MEQKTEQKNWVKILLKLNKKKKGAKAPPQNTNEERKTN
jgi:hypothetical protein